MITLAQLLEMGDGASIAELTVQIIQVYPAEERTARTGPNAGKNFWSQNILVSDGATVCKFNHIPESEAMQLNESATNMGLTIMKPRVNVYKGVAGLRGKIGPIADWLGDPPPTGPQKAAGAVSGQKASYKGGVTSSDERNVSIVLQTMFKCASWILTKESEFGSKDNDVMADEVADLAFKLYKKHQYTVKVEMES